MANVNASSGRPAADDFRIGRVLSQSLSVLWRNIFKLCLVAGATFLPLLLVVQILPANLRNPIAVGQSSIDLSAINFSSLAGSLAAVFVVVMVIFNFSHSVVYYIAVEDMRGRPVNLGDGLKIALGRFFPLIGMALLIFLAAVGFGLVGGFVIGALSAVFRSPVLQALLSIAFVVLYMMMMLMWSVAAPACVVERLGPLRSLSRSRELTHGHRWKILGLMLLTLICFLLVSVLFGVILVVVGIGLGSVINLVAPVGQVIGLVWDGLLLAFFWILIAATYRDLRVAKEGVDTDQIATVFE